jgi:pyruvate formate lyase activating enzyme
MTADEVMAKMLRNLPFYEGGGITVTGGEPLMQIDFVTELFAIAKKNGIHTCLDTSGVYFSEERETKQKYDKLIEQTDLVMLDIKHTDEDSHKKLCRHGIEAPRSFARYLSERGVMTRIRHVLLPGYTDSEENLKNLGKFIAPLSTIEKVEILPYHVLGKHKYANLGLNYPLEGISPPTESDVKRAEEIVNKAIFEAKSTQAQ